MGGNPYAPQQFTEVPPGWVYDTAAGKWLPPGPDTLAQEAAATGVGGAGPGPRAPLDPAAGAGGAGPGPRTPLVPPPAEPQTPAVWGTGGAGPGWRTTDVTAAKGPGPAPSAEQGFSPLGEPEERVAPRARGFGGAPAPSLPEELKPQYGGLYDPLDRDAFVSNVETLALQEKIPRQKAEQLIKDYDKRASTGFGLGTQLLRSEAETKERGAGLETRGAERQATLAEKTAGELEQSNKQIQQSRQAYQHEREKAQGALDREMGEYRAAIESLKTKAIDPNRWWKSRSTGEKVAFGITAFLAGAVSGFQGRSDNATLTFLRQAVDDDIASQRAAIENGDKAVAYKGTLLGRMRERLGDLDQAESASRSYAYEQLAARVRAHAQRESVAPDARDRAEVLAKELEKLPIDEETKIRMRSALTYEAAQLRAQQAAQAKVLKGSQFDERFVASPFGTGFVRDKDQAKDLDGKIAAWRHLDSVSAELEALLDKGPAMTGEDKGRAEFLTTEFKFAKNKAAKAGAFDKGTEELYGTQVEDPTAVWKNPETVAGKLRAGRQSHANQVRLEVQSAIQVPAERGMGQEGPVYKYGEPKQSRGAVREGKVQR